MFAEKTAKTLKGAILYFAAPDINLRFLQFAVL